MGAIASTFDDERAPTSPKVRPGLVVGGKYELERPIANGGMGTVWLARHVALGVPLAIKFMRETGAHQDPVRARARFEREAKACAQMRSPHVVQIVDYGLDVDGTPFLVMEWLSGEDLSTRLAREGALSLDRVTRMVCEIAEGLEVAHGAGVIHRDLKPSNVFLSETRGGEVVKLIDFGIAKQIGTSDADEEAAQRPCLTESGAILGSPEYMSPEQARGAEIDARSDLWALGVIVFVALTGRRPFSGTHVGDIIVKICTAELPRATSLAPHLPAEIDGFFERALCRSADGRFASARGLADELARVARPRETASIDSGLAGSPKPLANDFAGAADSSPGDDAPRSASRRSALAKISVPDVVVPRTDVTLSVSDSTEAQPAGTVETQRRAEVVATRAIPSSPATARTSHGRPWLSPWRWPVAVLGVVSTIGLVSSWRIRRAADSVSASAAAAESVPSATAPSVSPSMEAATSPAPSQVAKDAPPSPGGGGLAPRRAPATLSTHRAHPRTTSSSTVDPKFGLPLK